MGDIHGEEDRHAEAVRAEQVAGREIRRAQAHRGDVGRQLGERRRAGQQHRADPEPPEARACGDRVRGTGERDAGEDDDETTGRKRSAADVIQGHPPVGANRSRRLVRTVARRATAHRRTMPARRRSAPDTRSRGHAPRGTCRPAADTVRPDPGEA
jgi:hypothetical protein